jgi:hypothetical protein
MAHFAEIGLDNMVLRAIVVSNNVLLDENHSEDDQKGIDFCRKMFGGTWLQTSYNSTFRKNFAMVGGNFDSERNAFVETKPFPSWILNEENCIWEAPVTYPSDDGDYTWNEVTQSWVLSD